MKLFIYLFIYDLFICLFVLFIISLKSKKTITNPQTSLQAPFTFGKKLCGDETSIALSVLADVSLTSDGSASAEVQVRTGRTCERWKYHELCFQLSATLFANS